MNANASRALLNVVRGSTYLHPSPILVVSRMISSLNNGNNDKVNSQVFQDLISRDEVSTLADIFIRHNYELRIAGGAVRDFLHPSGNIIPHDVDFATDATPQQMKEMFTAENIRMINVEGGEKHGTITARILDKENFEVTTLRIDKVTDGRKAEVEFTTDWQLDAERRDLTINSMFLGLDGRLYDFFGGQKDLHDERVAFVGCANRRIQEDYLRILRYFRFYGRIVKPDDNSEASDDSLPRQKDHEKNTITAIKTNAEGLGRISGERIWSEWKKILSGRFGNQLTRTMLRQCNLGKYMGLPDNPNLEKLKEVWNTASTDGGITSSVQAPTLLASMLNTTEEMIGLHNRLKLSGYERDMALFVINHRYDADNKVIGGPQEVLKMYKWIFIDAKIKPKDVNIYIEELMKYRGEHELLEEWNNWEPPVFPVGGKDLKDNGCPPGKVFSQILNTLKKRWKESDFTMSKEDLIDILPSVMDEISETKALQKSKRNKSRTPSPS